MTQNTPNPADTSLAYIAKLEAETQRLTQERDEAELAHIEEANSLRDRALERTVAAQAAELQLSRLKAEVGEIAKALADLDPELLKLHDWIAEETRETSRIRAASALIGRYRALLAKLTTLPKEPS